VYDVPSTDEDTFFPVFSAACRERGISSALSLPLQVRKAPVGSLNFYAREAQRFGGPVREKARGLAREASLVLAQAQEAFRPDETAEQLQEALETRDIIGTAKGILMEREAVSIDEAFQMLVRVSQTRNVKLREIARQVVAQHGQA
jgi:hypothetical protein